MKKIIILINIALYSGGALGQGCHIRSGKKYPTNNKQDTTMYAFAVSPKGNQVVCAFYPNFLYAFALHNGELSNGTQINFPDTIKTFPSSITYSPDGSYIATINADPNLGVNQTVSIFENDHGRITFSSNYNFPSYDVTPMQGSIAFTQDGNNIVLGVVVYDTVNGTTTSYGAYGLLHFNEGTITGQTFVPLIDQPAVPLAIAATPNSQYIAVAAMNGTNTYSPNPRTHNFVQIAKLVGNTVAPVASYPLKPTDREPSSMIIAPNGNHVATFCKAMYDLTLFEMKKNGKLDNRTIYTDNSYSNNGQPQSITFSPDSNNIMALYFYAGDYTTTLVMFDLDGKSHDYNGGLLITPNKALFVPNQNYLIVGDWSGYLVVYQTSNCTND